MRICTQWLWRSSPLLLLLLSAGCREEAKYAKPLTTVRVQPVELYRGEQGQRYSGNIEPLTRVDIVFRLGGYIDEILKVQAGGQTRLVQEGDPVTKETVLVKLRQNDYTVKVDEAKSQLDQAKFAVTQSEEAVKGTRALRDKAQLDWARANTLYQKQSLTKPDYDGARAQLDGYQAQLDANVAQQKLAEARVAGAEALLREADIAVGDSSVKSPIDATVLKRLVEVGALVAPGTPAFVLGDVHEVKTVFGVSDTVLPEIRMGMRLPVTSEALPGATYTGRVTRIAPTADPRTRVFDIELTVPNTDGRLKPGMIASLTLSGKTAREAVPVIPLAAVVQPPPGKSGYMVYVAADEGGKAVAKAQMVQLGDALGDRISVRGGLSEGQRVVVTGASLVHDGEAVEVLP
ncbi:MAG TPA: efflux RND transporter periplasmic adaptor subunit [Bryobacteraceae bacterium]|jgi:multidrug efflux system membrane fusion protein|nr:efflux RND transporter periplasmic adaptor subunit [Bryobacteraceae bacterium]